LTVLQQLTADSIQGELREVKLRQLSILCEEVQATHQFGDQEFVRMLECVYVVTEELQALARSIEMDVAQLQAIVTRGKSSCVHEVPAQKRKTLLVQLIDTSVALIGNKSS